MNNSDTLQYRGPYPTKTDSVEVEFSSDHDSFRKKRRNRTTQSCLNCHTSKRKCDRKRPCQRCIQLGLTGLCVYEIDDPSTRDDPALDETTRLRNRIAELESLVRELRGKPHPRWADSKYTDANVTEKWHSRAQRTATTKGRHSPDNVEDYLPDDSGNIPSLHLPPIKTEAQLEVNPELYRFTPSPAPSLRFQQGFQGDGRVNSAPFENTGISRPSFEPHAFHSPPAASTFASSLRLSTRTSYPVASGSNSNYSINTTDDSGNYVLQSYSPGLLSPSPPSPHCACRSHPLVGQAYMALAQQLQSTVATLRQYNQHATNSSCELYRGTVELNHIMRMNESPLDGPSGTPFDALSTPPESDSMTPHSASSGQLSFRGSSSGNPSPQEHFRRPSGGLSSPQDQWQTNLPSNLNPYFPVQASDLYNHSS